ncbi:hypothetical protein ACA910_019783 [Epithemia clementina (nom. ined.)]
MAPKSKKEEYIDWHNSKARAIIIGDLEPGGMLEGLDSVKPEILLEFYKNYMLEMFVGVVLDQFKASLRIIENKQAKVLSRLRGIKKHTIWTDLFIPVKIATVEENWFLIFTLPRDFYDKMLLTNSTNA